MTLYYDRDGITIYCGETLATMAQLADPFHAIIADLPYGTTACSWDTIIPFAPLWKQYKRLTTGAVVLFGSQPFTSALVMSCPEWFKYEWIWRKTKYTNFAQIKGSPGKIHENICVFSGGTIPRHLGNPMVYNPQGAVEINQPTTYIYGGKNNFMPNRKKKSIHGVQSHTDYPVSIIKFGSEAKSLHPTQKPVALLAYLIRTYTNPGEIVLDNTMGSGTTLVAAQREGRRATGIDNDENYCKIAVERLRQPTFWSIPAEATEQQVEQATLL